MRGILFILFSLVVVVLGGCSKGTLYISGDEEAVGAEIYIDGQKVGVMEKHVYAGPTSNDPRVLERDKRLQQKLGIKSGDIFSGADIRIQSGTHEVMFINKEGKKLNKVIQIQGQNYIGVDFRKMNIESD